MSKKIDIYQQPVCIGRCFQVGISPRRLVLTLIQSCVLFLRISVALDNCTFSNVCPFTSNICTRVKKFREDKKKEKNVCKEHVLTLFYTSLKGVTWSPRLSPASSALLLTSTLLIKRRVPRSAPPISVKGRGISRADLFIVITLGLALAAQAMLSNRN